MCHCQTNKLRDILDSMPEYRLIIATHIPLKIALRDVKTDFPGSFTNVAFRGIGEKGANDLLKSREETNGIEYTPDALDRAYTLSCGHPFFVRHLGEEILGILRESDRNKVQRIDVDNAFALVLESCGTCLLNDYSEGTDTFHRQMLHKLAEDDTRALEDLRELMLSAGLGASEFTCHYYDLIDMGLLVPDDEQGKKKPHFANEFLKAYITQLLGLDYNLPDAE